MRYLLTFFLFTGFGRLCAQQNDTSFHATGIPAITINDTTKTNGTLTDHESKLTFKKLAVPLSLISYGMITRASGELQDLDHSIHDIVSRVNGSHTSVDNYLQYAPGLAVYVLNAAGVKGKHNLLNSTILFLLSNAIVGITVEPTKGIFKVRRPDGSSANSFPSGHTATAFAGAEFLRQEYKDVSPWYGIAGYAVATTTGFLRMYNNKHWFSDVVAGAGFGILSTRLAYWLGPIIFRKSFYKKSTSVY